MVCTWPCDLMDKALVFGTKDCRFESCQGHFSAGGRFIAEGCQFAEFWVPAQARKGCALCIALHCALCKICIVHCALCIALCIVQNIQFVCSFLVFGACAEASSWQRQHSCFPQCCRDRKMHFSLAPQNTHRGLEPTTTRLRALRSAD